MKMTECKCSTKKAHKKCTTGHKGHICVLVSEGRFEDIRELVNSPKYLCFNCGRVADKKTNLCNPMPLKS